MSRRVLMLCYLYPPVLASGVTRSVAFARNLPAFGWVPTVLTVETPRDAWVSTGEPVPADVDVVRSYEWNLDRVVEITHGVTDRLLRPFGVNLERNYIRDAVCIPDSHIAWLSTGPASKLARACDVVYATCSPFSSAISACRIKKRTGTPVVVDFRDAWSLNPHARHVPHHRAMVSRLERWVVSTCDALVVNTSGAERLYRQRYPEAKDRIIAIPNGYDELNLPPSDLPPSPAFSVMHVGNFYGSRNPARLLEAMTRLQLPGAEFVQVGAPCAEMAAVEGRVPTRLVRDVAHAEALRIMQSASVLYLRQGEEPGITDYIAVAAKTYEYLATGRPILAECPPGDNADLVREYGESSEVVSSASVDDVAAALGRLYSRRETARPRVDPRFAAEFDRRHLTARLAGVFDAVVARGGTR